jgi:methylisocitrate lyase
MPEYKSPGARFREAMRTEDPLQIVGCVNAYGAKLAERAGFRAIYVSGAGVSSASLAVPDLAIATMDDFLTDVRRISDASDLPLLVDIDTGFGGAFNIARTIRSMIKFGAAAIHIEDQVAIKRCGHRPNKMIVSQQEMVDRIHAAVDARTDPAFVIVGRTDALAVEGIDAALDRARAFVEAGVDVVFPEAVSDLETYTRFAEATGAPILANITEFGRSPLFTVDELKSAKVNIVLYPMSAFRAMSNAAQMVFETIRRDGTQKAAIDKMQTRNELYEILGYHDYERRLDQLFGAETQKAV